MAKSGHKGVSRIDSPRKKMHGWYVRVRFNHQTRSKFIPDRLHGGKEAALVKAVECRDELERELGKPRTDWVVVGRNPRNPVGVAGVRRAVKKYKGKDGRVYLNEVYEVSWNAGRERKGRTSVSIRKYGELRAFRMACAIRREKERLMYGEPVEGKWAEALSKVCAA
jgi:hypothetical protein